MRINFEKIKEISDKKYFINHSPVNCPCCLNISIAKGILEFKKKYPEIETKEQVINCIKRELGQFGDIPENNTILFFNTYGDFLLIN